MSFNNYPKANWNAINNSGTSNNNNFPQFNYPPDATFISLNSTNPINHTDYTNIISNLKRELDLLDREIETYNNIIDSCDNICEEEKRVSEANEARKYVLYKKKEMSLHYSLIKWLQLTNCGEITYTNLSGIAYTASVLVKQVGNPSIVEYETERTTGKEDLQVKSLKRNVSIAASTFLKSSVSGELAGSIKLIEAKVGATLEMGFQIEGATASEVANSTQHKTTLSYGEKKKITLYSISGYIGVQLVKVFDEKIIESKKYLDVINETSVEVELGFKR